MKMNATTSAPIHADLTELIFADRNQSYGAYAMRKEHPRTMMNAFFIAGISLLGFLLLMNAFQSAPAVVEDFSRDGIMKLTEVHIPPKPDPIKKTVVPPVKEKEKAKPKTEPKVDKMKGMDTKELKEINPKATADPNATMAEDTAFTDKQPGLADSDTSDSNALGGDPTGTGETPPVDKPEGPPGDGTGTTDIPDFNDVHFGDMPTPLNLDDIRKKIGYPSQASELGMEGKVNFRVLVDEKGKYMRHLTMFSSHPIFEKACLKELKRLQFTPGMMGEQAVKVWVVIPFKFSLLR